MISFLHCGLFSLISINRDEKRLFRQAQFYEAEAKGLRILGQEEDALEAEQKASALYQQYASKKLEIRAEYPSVVEAESEPEDGANQ